MARELYTTPFINDPFLINYWRLEGNSNDSKGSNNGTDTSMSYGANYGRFGQGGNFSGSGYILTTPSSLPINTSPGTMNCWFRLTDSTARERGLIAYGSAAAGKVIRVLTIRASHKLGTETGSGADALLSTNTVNDGIWHMATLTYNGTVLSMYLDGALVGSSTTTLATASSQLSIGSITWSLGYTFIGDIDDVSLFSRGLSASEVSRLYNASIKKFMGEDIDTIKKVNAVYNQGSELIAHPLYSDANLVSYWRLEGNSNDSKASNNGTDTNISYGTAYGKFGQGAYFNVANNQITMGNVSALRPAAFTFNAWVKFSALTNAYTCIMGSNNSGDTTYQVGFVKSNGKLACYVNASGGSVNFDGSGIHTLTTGVWYMLTYSYSSSDGLKGYVNAVLDASAAANGTAPTGDADTETMLGNQKRFTTSRFLQGNMDEASIFSRVLTIAEIQSLYNTSVKKVSGISNI